MAAISLLQLLTTVNTQDNALIVENIAWQFGPNNQRCDWLSSWKRTSGAVEWWVCPRRRIFSQAACCDTTSFWTDHRSVRFQLVFVPVSEDWAVHLVKHSQQGVRRGSSHRSSKQEQIWYFPGWQHFLVSLRPSHTKGCFASLNVCKW